MTRADNDLSERIISSTLIILSDGRPRTGREIAQDLARLGLTVDKSLVNSVLYRNGAPRIRYNRENYSYCLVDTSEPSNETSTVLFTSNHIITESNDMTTFPQWNEAIINFTLSGLSIGSRVFLSIDDATLEAIGSTFSEPRPQTGWIEDFKRSVRHQCVVGDEIRLARFTSPLRDSRNFPCYIPFLAAMVLAAHNMGDAGDDHNIASHDYFTHFNSVMGLSDQQGRPKGLATGEDGNLWEDWNRWLRTQGFLPTAVPGDPGAYKYTRYPISQTVLRQSDRNSLWRHFTDRSWRKNYDEVLLMQRIRKDAQYFTRHLREILHPDSDMWQRSYEAISLACYEVYEDWREAGGTASKTQATARVRTTLDAGLYRTADYFSGTVEYQLFPRQPRHAASIALSVQYQGDSHPLSEDRPGWYAPLWSVDWHQLTHGIKLPLESSNSYLQHLYFPTHDFWILTLDPQMPESGIYASWDKGVEIGNPFILLAKEKLSADLIRLKNEGLLEWESSNTIFDDWREYRGVTVQAEERAWASISLGENDDLRLTLQPRTNFNLTVTGGLRAPRGLGWLVGHGPQVSLASFIVEAELAVYTEDDEKVFSSPIEAGTMISIPWGAHGNYKIVVTQNGRSEERVVRILDWSELDIRPLDAALYPSEDNFGIYGALVKD